MLIFILIDVSKKKENKPVDMTITFPGGKKVNAEVDGMVIKTDQPKEAGGDGSAPSPFTTFLASIGTCAGIYILGFCQQRGIPTDKMLIKQRMEFSTDKDGNRQLSKIAMEIVVPPDFPKNYYNAIIKTAELCAVKKTIMHPPVFEITTKVV